ncbi:Protein RKD5 [Morella rubra]|uniref:Protein RKD5 n=1 Tax=Morella rubra TaxID=262757 RepID=A0A6A1UP68_9ROSI|nr:Protein RKD5 [Morella rubra]
MHQKCCLHVLKDLDGSLVKNIMQTCQQTRLLRLPVPSFLPTGHYCTGFSIVILYFSSWFISNPYVQSSLKSFKTLLSINEGALDPKKKRAASEHIAGIALSDLAKYFDLPIVEASRNLKVGLTVLKKKCREFGIPRWPHRKIKSLDSLIQDLQAQLFIENHLQEEAKRQQQVNEAAAMAVARRQSMLESEKETMESKPFMELQSETKRFRQDVFKRRHRARALRDPEPINLKQ